MRDSVQQGSSNQKELSSIFFKTKNIIIYPNNYLINISYLNYSHCSFGATEACSLSEEIVEEWKPYGYQLVRSRIVRFITLLDPDIDIVIRPRDASRKPGHVSVLFAV